MRRNDENLKKKTLKQISDSRVYNIITNVDVGQSGSSPSIEYFATVGTSAE